MIEDLHWADALSREALLILARRLSADRALIIVTTRPGAAAADGWERFSLDTRRCESIQLAPLTSIEITELTAHFGVTLTPASAQRLEAHTAGHALYVTMLLAELRPEQLAAAVGDLPAPHSLSATTAARLGELPSSAVLLASALAVLGRPVELPVVARVSGIDAASSAVDALVASDLVTLSTGSGLTVVGFAHPLLRAAVYGDLSPLRRQQLHLAAARELGPVAGLPHRVSAADGPDDMLADHLVEGARDALGAGGTSVAARNLLWAAGVRSDRAAADRHLLSAARVLMADGQIGRAAGMRDQIAATSASRTRELVLGMLDWEEGGAASAEGRLRAAAGPPEPSAFADGRDMDGDDGEVSMEALAHLGRLYVTTGRGEEAVAASERLLAQTDLRPPLERAAWINAANAALMRDGGPAGLTRLSARLPAAAEDVAAADVDLLITRGTIGYFAARTESAIADLRIAIGLIRSGATATELPRAHLQLSRLCFQSGDWDEGVIHGRLALAVVSERQLVWMRAQAHATLATLMSARGRWDEAAAHLSEASDAASAIRTPEATFTFRIATAHVARARGDWLGVLAAFAPLMSGGLGAAAARLPMSTSLMWWAMIITASIEMGDLPSAQAQIDLFAEAADARGLDLTAQILGARAHLMAAGPAAGTAEANGAIDLYRDALSGDTNDVPALDRAELHQRLGRLLSARGARREAAAVLNAAHRMLADAGATPYLERLAADLQAVGHAATDPNRPPAVNLTERESDVVALVVKGMTNREVAAELYVTEKAVEYHLGNVYGKLGIRSRRDLAPLIQRA